MIAAAPSPALCPSLSAPVVPELPEGCCQRTREIVRLRVVERLPHAEIAARCGCSRTWVALVLARYMPGDRPLPRHRPHTQTHAQEPTQ